MSNGSKAKLRGALLRKTRSAVWDRMALEPKRVKYKKFTR